jgi:hypothetical protein
MMKNRSKWAAVMTLLILPAAVGFAANYSLDERDSVDLTGIDEVEFNLRGVNCALCVRTLGIDTTLTGDGPGGEMILTLNGEISSNRERGVPSPIVEKERNKLVVRLYPNQPSFFVLSQSGSAIFEARLPQSFQGKIKAVGSSDSIMVSRFDLKEMDINSSSGSVTATDIKAESASFEVSSGKFAGNEIRSSGRLDIESSSGALDIGRIEGTEVTIEASSGESAWMRWRHPPS